MARDQAGRPIVVVTGYGVVTSLGAGCQDNWAKLTAGQSGIRAITRFATDGLKTRIAGTVDFVSITPSINAPELARRVEGAGAAAVVIGYRLAMLLAGAGALVIAQFAGWFWAYAAMATEKADQP